MITTLSFLAPLFSAVAQADRVTLAATETPRLIDVDGVRVAVHDPRPEPPSDAGGPAVVCLHAVGHGSGDFLSVTEGLAETHRVISLDWPGHGASDDDRLPASAERYADVLSGILDVLGLDSVVLIGNSIGGAAAIRHAAERPDQVRGVVLADPGGLDPGGPVARWYIGRVASRFARGADGDPGFPSWYARFYRKVLTTEAAIERRDAIVAAGPEMAGVLAQAWLSFATPQADLRSRLPELTMPVLVAWADGDRVIRWSRNRAAIRILPSARVVRFAGGHSPFLEAPEAFVAELRSFLGSLSDGGPPDPPRP